MTYRIEIQAANRRSAARWLRYADETDLQTVENISRSWIAKGYAVRIIPHVEA